MTVSRDVVKQIVEKALWYPSGDNCQPFRFKFVDQRLHIIHCSERADHPLNPDCMASKIALGCLIEALWISASRFGLQIVPKVTDHILANKDCWATIEFVVAESDVDPLFHFLEQRSTDRREFQNGRLPSHLFHKTDQLNQDYLPAHLHWVTNISPPMIDYIVKAEKLMMDHPLIIHKVLEWTRFTEADVRQQRDGLSLKNMGVMPWEAPSVLLIKRFPAIMQVIRGVMIRQHAARVLRQLKTSAALIYVSIPANELQNTVSAGKLMFRIWLELTAAGFGVQPLTIPSMLVALAQEDKLRSLLSPEWDQFFKEGERIFKSEFGLPQGHVPVWMCRTGKMSILPPEFRTLRLSVDAVLKFED